MNRIKILILAAFLFGAGALYFLPSSRVSGQTGALSAPTGVVASDGKYTTKVGIHWDTIRNATSYRIFRSATNNPATATDIGTTVAPYFFDTTAPQNQSRFYWVRAENTSGVSPMSSSSAGLRVNGIPNNPAAPLEPPPAPLGNPVTATKVYLGKTLFWDEQLSSTRTVSCGTCHINGTSGSDPRSSINNPASTNPGPDTVFGTGDDITASPGVPLSNAAGNYDWTNSYGIGVQVTTRKTNSSINAGYTDELFWDGRAGQVFNDPITGQVVLAAGAALESQAAGPPVSDVEMAHSGRDWAATALQIRDSKPLGLVPSMPQALETWIGGRSYPELFQEAFGSDEVTPAKIAMAIATYERVLFSDQTPFDLLVGGAGQGVLTAQEQAGRAVFNNANCLACHGGSRQTNDLFLYIGVRPQNDDLGRFTVTGQNNNRGSFRVPSLRNVELRAPYMHNGRFATLDDVVAFYNRGGDFNAPNKAPQIVPQGFTPQQRADLAAYLKRPFTDPRVANETPPFDRPTMYTESNRVPVVSGTGRQGVGGVVPNVMAVEPPFAGNPSFTVGVSNAAPNAPAVLVISSTDPGVGTTIPSAGTFARRTTTLSNNGTGNGYGSVSIEIPSTQAVVGQTFFGRWYVTDAAAPNGFSVSRLFQFTVFGEATSAPAGTKFDFDGDSKSDVSIFRPSAGEWWYRRSIDGIAPAYQFGTSTDVPAPADFSGDGKTDIAFFRPSSGEWFILNSDGSGFYSFPFGTAGDIPAPGDYDGDGKADVGVFRPSSATWFILRSSDSQTQFVSFGAAEDKPVTGDFDNDNKDDIAIYRPSVSQFWILRSTAGLAAYQFGTVGDKAMAADFSGDGSDDIAVFRPSTGFWFVLRSEDQGFYGFPFGTNGDLPAPGDYDGDGTADPTVFRPTDVTWYSLQSTAGTQITSFGGPGDTPVPGAYVTN